jgi:quercetin dioxygenase-like cupin family protein
MPGVLSVALLAATMLLAQAAGVVAQDKPDRTSLQWVVPPLLPPGALLAVVSGDPTQPGQSTIEVSMPDGYRLPPHTHPSFEHVEVKQGTLLVGMGDQLDVAKTVRLTVGDTATAPAGMHHYSVAKGPTIVAVTFMGPYTITYLHTYEAPKQQHSFPFTY